MSAGRMERSNHYQVAPKPDNVWQLKCDAFGRWFKRLRLLSGNRVSSVGDTRTIFVGLSDDIPEAQKSFVGNRIKTSKYTLWNFIPKNLFEQFRRIANFYFLIVAIVAVSIDSPVTPVTSVLPLIFVILVTAFKQAYEDFLRYRSDKEVNCYPVTVFRNGCLQELKAQEVRVGDVVKVVSDTEIPCDLVLLSTSDTSGRCYITTANLDGETNLKTLFCPRMLRNVAVNDELAELRARVECEQPTPDLYRFYGKIMILPSASPTDLATASIRRNKKSSYRKSGRSTASVRASVGNGTAGNGAVGAGSVGAGSAGAGSVGAGSAGAGSVGVASVGAGSCSAGSVKMNARSSMKSKDPKDRRLRGHQRSVSFVTGKGAADDVAETEMGAPEPRTSILSSYSERGVDVECGESKRSSKSLSGHSFASFRRALSRRESMRSDVRRDARPSYIKREVEESAEPEDLKRLSQLNLTAPLGTENLLLRGHRLKNTEYIYGCAVYTGQETKLALNSKMTSVKFSSVEKSINKFLIFFVVLLLCEVALTIALKYIMEAAASDSEFWYIGGTETKTAKVILQDLFSFIILFNYIIPISLYVTIEMQKFLGTIFFENDLEMYDPKLDEAPICNTSDLNEELGQIQYLFTDKTGTLTENTMWFRRCSVNGVSYLEDDGKLYVLPPNGDENKKTLVKDYPPDLELFLLSMAVCHSVQVESTGSFETDFDPEAKLNYEASSPDEKALVEASARLGVIFVGEKDDIIYVRQHGKLRRFVTRNCLEFTSDRKRMSVVVSDEDGVVWLFCKGAESHVAPLVVDGDVDNTMAAVSDFAVRGLRAMVIGYRRLTESEYTPLSETVDAARQDLTNLREERIAASYDQMESNLTLLGATGVEDQLQDGVKETLESLRDAGIKVWILTGDKVETAVNISFSCGHFKPGATLLYLTECRTEESMLALLNRIRLRLSEEGVKQFSLIVDGMTLAFALKHTELFLELCQKTSAVICCRMSPLQKCEVVHLIKTSPEKPITAAIGDGANDVSMIQEAHVGLGLMGKEGRQAVRCADFAFSRFRFLRRALLVHGHWYYLRVATLVQYSFYKNIVFITPQFFFAFFNVFSTQPLYDSWFLTLYNIQFSSLPILMYGLFEQNYPAKTLLDQPPLYQKNTRDALMTWKCFFTWNGLGLWHAIIIYYLPYAMVSVSDLLLSDHTPIDISCFDTTIMHTVVAVVNIKILMYSRYWSGPFLFCVFASILYFIGFTTVYTTVASLSTGDMLDVYVQLMSSPSFWLLTIVLVVLCLIPDSLLVILAPQAKMLSDRLKQLCGRPRRRLDSQGSWWSRKNASFTLNEGENSRL